MTYKPRDAKPYLISESDVALYIDCARCFFQHHREDRPRPTSESRSTETSENRNLRSLFDKCAAQASVRPHTFGELRFRDPWTNLDITSPVGDVWINAQEELVLVGFKDRRPEPGPDGGLPLPLKRQLDISFWLLRQQEVKVSNQAYWIFADELVSYRAKDGWVRAMLTAVKDCLEADRKPAASSHCGYCHSSSSLAKSESV